MLTTSRLSLKQVRAIDAVARTRGIAQAAAALNTTQAVISRAIATAEEALGTALFERGWGGTDPTARGELVLQRCTAALMLVAEAEDDIEAASGIRPKLTTFLRWHHLDAVAAIAQMGSASKAAAYLGMTQPAVSRAVAAIGDYAAQPLFERKREGLEATPQARRLASLRDRLLQEIGMEVLKEVMAGSGQGLFGRLAVGMLPFSGQDLVIKAFGELTNRHPDLRLMALPGSYNMLTEALMLGEIDCMIGILREPSPIPDLTEIPLGSEAFTLVARHDHPCLATARSMSDLIGEKWIVGQHGSPIRAYFDGLFKTIGATPPAQTCEIHSFAGAERLVMESNSLALLSYGERQLAALPAELRKVEVALPDAQTRVGLTVRRNGEMSEIVRLFEALLRGYLA
ncbi:LysR family transcriptional regulator [Oricola sp.]|uniref:LysR family transcriptional regulator n=1 Tax=Oricola sp. TaxID=1979950 RepID=UPI0025DC4DD1|nr:LysR family transcriptional regulator [Oricola sp.]MCI5076162.1 LysR family transcriptional regulator [Oricola sp.]